MNIFYMISYLTFMNLKRFFYLLLLFIKLNAMIFL